MNKSVTPSAQQSKRMGAGLELDFDLRLFIFIFLPRFKQ
jgi:hypothetical protein